MRRALTSICLTLLSFPLIAPLPPADTDSELPACCRRNGKHHCSMMAMADQKSPPGPAVRAIQPKCPYYPAANAVPSEPNAALPGNFPAISALFFSRSAGRARTEAGYRISFSRSRQKRGPPAPFS
jgi:hypothetical protein